MLETGGGLEWLKTGLRGVSESSCSGLQEVLRLRVSKSSGNVVIGLSRSGLGSDNIPCVVFEWSVTVPWKLSPFSWCFLEDQVCRAWIPILLFQSTLSFV